MKYKILSRIGIAVAIIVCLVEWALLVLDAWR